MDIPPVTFNEKKTSYIVPVRADVSDTESRSDDEDIESKHLDECLVADSGDEYDEIHIGRNKSMELVIGESDIEPEEIALEKPQPKKMKKEKKPVVTYTWSEEDIPTNDVEDLPPSEITEILSPMEYFTQFFSLDIMADIVHQTNIYSTEKTGSSLQLTNAELTEHISITLTMSIIKLPAISDYGARNTQIDQVADMMPLRRFTKTRNILLIILNYPQILKTDFSK
ncbi:uncharacterized protein LOC126884000 [Diabrotica virgifera virgifera]|nr:uncharacterized protein LOC126884000 [Diabrotica virgifera virgifera]